MKPTLALALAASAALTVGSARAETDPTAVLDAYADIAQAGYEDSLTTARSLKATIDAFLKAPDARGLEAARAAWRAARVPYQQTEAFRFGNPAVDDWEGRVNAWPLDEGMIDYVDAGFYGEESDDNPFYTANVIANPRVVVAGQEVDAGRISPDLLRSLQEVDAVEANVATGYHAIEFLLWGQDVNGTGPGAGARPFTDYSLEACTGGHCDRRRDYLVTAADLLIADLKEMTGAWAEGGGARADLMGRGPSGGLTAVLTGIGSLSYGEMAGERMQLGLMLHDPEEEHDCFADNTHNSHFYDQQGMRNVYTGRYVRTDGSVIEGLGLDDLAAERAPAANAEMLRRLDATTAAMTALKQRGDTTETYDQMIGEGNAEGNAVVQAVIDRLKDQTKAVEGVVAALKLDPIAIEGSDSLDNPDAVFQ